MGQIQIFMKLTTIYGKNWYLCSKSYEVIAIFTINYSNFHENLSLSHGYYRK